MRSPEIDAQREPLFLAVDAGGTKTDLLLAGSRRELARIRTGSIKILGTPPEAAEENLRTALRELEAAAGIPIARVTRICAGASGYSVPLVANWIRERFAAEIGAELLLCGDEEIALDAAFEGSPGILVLAGTGSNVIGRSPGGRILSVGGWGPVLGDEGSGHWIGLSALRRALQARDEGRASNLLDSMQQAWNLPALCDLIERGNAIPPPPFAELTPVVLRCAQAGDALAAEVLAHAGEELARLVQSLLSQMRALEPAQFAPPPVAFAGSILQNIAQVRESMTAALRRTCPELTFSVRHIDPVLGALWRVRQAVR